MFAINNMLDDLITKKLRNYLAMEQGLSDVVVKDGNIAIDKLFLKPETINGIFAARKLPVKVKLFHVQKAEVKIPWLHPATKNVEVNVQDLMVLLHPLSDDELTVEQV